MSAMRGNDSGRITIPKKVLPMSGGGTMTGSLISLPLWLIGGQHSLHNGPSRAFTAPSISDKASAAPARRRDRATGKGEGDGTRSILRLADCPATSHPPMLSLQPRRISPTVHAGGRWMQEQTVRPSPLFLMPIHSILGGF